MGWENMDRDTLQKIWVEKGLTADAPEGYEREFEALIEEGSRASTSGNWKRLEAILDSLGLLP